MTGQGKTRETKNESRKGHGNASKIGFLFDAYSVVSRYTRAGRNCEMRFQTIKLGSGLPNNYYQLQGKTVMNTGFFY
ncbi:MAG: hypothetical protein ACD_39C01204G0003 [uncultured bacterium]|nr:MAG: hypothetical protein ACD_39C01204G0003 [uncultured bacterium]